MLPPSKPPLTEKHFMPHLEDARASFPAAANALLHGKHEPKHHCCVLVLLHSCTWAFTASIPQLNHNKLWIDNSLAIKGNSHALSHEVAAHVVTIPMQLCVCVCVSGFFPPKTDALGLAIHTPSLNQSGYDETPTIPWTHSQFSPLMTTKAPC